MRFSVNIKQHDISDCGVASLASVAAHYGLKLPLARIRLNSGTDSSGTTIRGIIEAAEKFGLTAKGYKGKITSLYKVPKPVILHLKKSTGLLHFVVLYKISKQHFHIMDPIDGKINRISNEEFSREWTGYLIIVEPSENFVKGREGVSVITRLLSFIRRDIKEYSKALIFSIIYILIALSTSIFIKYIIDNILPENNQTLLFLISLIMAALVLISFILSYYKSLLLLRISIQTDRKLILSYLRQLFKLPQQFFDLRKTGELTSRVDDAFKIRNLLSDIVINITISTLTLIISLILLFTIFWKLALVVLVFIPVYLLLYFLYDRFNKKIQREIMEQAAQFESSLIEGIKSIKSIKHFGIETFTVSRIKEKLNKLNSSLLKAGKRGIIIFNLGETSSRFLSLAVLWFGGYFVLSSTFSIGDLVSFYTVTAMFSGPLSALIGLNITIREGFTAAERLFEIMDLEGEMYNTGIIKSIESSETLTVENLSFCYKGREPLFKGFCMKLCSGKITALSGESGCGKSTIASLILRMQSPDSGVISLDGININHINLEYWRQWVTIVPQNLDLFAGTLIENIAPGENDPDYEFILQICGDLNLLPFIESLPSGFETQIGEGGSLLSRGQQQRIAIARALYRKSKILILDEATSSVDITSEELIEKAVKKAKEMGKMILMISHRERNINIADIVIRI